MKKIAIIVGLFLGSSLYSMNNEEHWYTSFYRQYPNTITTVKNGLFSFGFYYGLDFLRQAVDATINPVWTKHGTILFFSVKTAYDYMKKPDILEKVQTCPQELLQHNNTFRYIAQDVAPIVLWKINLHENWVRSNTITAEWMLKNINFFEKKYSPIFLLGECNQVGDRYCTLGRNWQPEYRNVYENTLVNIMTKKLKNSDKEIHYVDFGHGGLFQTFVTITKMLIKNNTAKLSLHLIDRNNGHYVKMRDYLKNGREVGKLFCDQPDSVMNKLKEDAKQIMNNEDFLSADLLIKKCTLQTSELLRQLHSFFEEYFPKARVRIFVYESTDDYCNNIAKNNALTADVVTTADIQDDLSYLRNAQFHYVKLCLNVLQKNKKSHNLWLEDDHSGLHGGASLVRITDDSDKQFKNYTQKAATLEMENHNGIIQKELFYVYRKNIAVNWLGKEKN